MHQPHDSGYKRLFSHPEMVRDLLTGFVDEPWVQDVDFEGLERYPGEFVDDRLQGRRNDLIWRLPWGTDWLYVYLLLEFQSGVHPFMAARLSTYVDLLYQDLIRARQFARRRPEGATRAAPRAPRRLPPVVPLVLYNGRRPWTAPRDLADLIEPGPPTLEACRPRLRYLLVDASAYDETVLAARHNLVAALFRLENSRDPERVCAVIIALAEWMSDPEQRELRHSFVVWLREAFLATRLPGVALPELTDLEEIRTMLSERVLSWTEQWKQDGWKQGLEQGLISERRLLLRQIQRRFGAAVAERSARVLVSIHDPAVLEDLGEAVLDCPDAAGWEARLAGR
ncbi:Rpn family recombination-promoting nuclease/putative transposase [uncultured Thiocystis sp.]|jgi:hypothetical protein|uniref:Rpn family recombination-promoting nuclease/putative transposase n=1 Tax=uncultured Thiocystis sp. TaxID=1202134 RepID=UPI0025E0423B|nr:Rpn family recombination-promoting nuclease/putative transposase [uncultured Thiocystis sp.]